MQKIEINRKVKKAECLAKAGIQHNFKGWRQQGSNLRPSTRQADALPAELYLHTAILYDQRKKINTRITIFVDGRENITYNSVIPFRDEKEEEVCYVEEITKR